MVRLDEDGARRLTANLYKLVEVVDVSTQRTTATAGALEMTSVIARAGARVNVPGRSIFAMFATTYCLPRPAAPAIDINSSCFHGRVRSAVNARTFFTVSTSTGLPSWPHSLRM